MFCRYVAVPNCNSFVRSLGSVRGVEIIVRTVCLLAGVDSKLNVRLYLLLALLDQLWRSENTYSSYGNVRFSLPK